jgi:hypothetical protein
MGKTFGGFDPETYATVAERIRLFYTAHPLGRIHTELVSRSAHEVVFKALVFRTPDDDRPAATGWAAEREGDGEINLVACLENTETSAVGRALANLGFTASRERPSREEMIRSARARQRYAVTERYREEVAKPNEGGTRELRLPLRDHLDAERDEGMDLPGGLDADPLRQQANEIVDALALVRTAARFGLRRARSDRLRLRMLDGGISANAREQWTAMLRRWIEKRRAEAMRNPYLG